MDNDLKVMWVLLTAGIFILMCTVILNILAMRADLETTWFAVIFTAAAIATSSAFFVGAFVAAVDYMKVQLNDN